MADPFCYFDAAGTCKSGWGEHELLAFRPLNLACANGAVETAKVLLMNGADPNHKCAWDGGGEIPITMSGGDYWYTDQNTALHQAARGNHVKIIELLLRGPDQESIKYAEANNINLSQWRSISIEAKSREETIYKDRDESAQEEVELTPLGMALIFGNIEAALALLAHGAQLSSFGSKIGCARWLLMKKLCEEGSAGRSVILQNLDFVGSPAEKQAFVTFLEQEDGDDDDQEEEEEPWEKDDWDEFKVRMIYYDCILFVENIHKGVVLEVVVVIRLFLSLYSVYVIFSGR